MENEKQQQINQRLQRKAELDEAMARGALTLDELRMIAPTETSPEHHQTLIRQLSARAVGSAL